MNKSSKIRRKTLELDKPARPSRIRREPPPQPDNALVQKLDRIDWSSPEWEVRLTVAGIIFFALALSALVIDLGEVMSH